MTRTALFHNTIIALPTGLGKTMIASTVIYNFNRWFPTGICIFVAPTKPLVQQQIESCFQVTGMSQKITCEMTGEATKKKRMKLWKDHKIIFATPQTIVNDLMVRHCFAPLAHNQF